MLSYSFYSSNGIAFIDNSHNGYRNIKTPDCWSYPCQVDRTKKTSLSSNRFSVFTRSSAAWSRPPEAGGGCSGLMFPSGSLLSSGGSGF